ncbi:50S ribosomal protein L2, partial [Candidatus Curtissbacteria bacterium]|nr:50S ribosomal protein L2 [Candidatus Curtissbacteria bacterium]
MPVKIHRPISPSLRHRTSLMFDEITRSMPEKSLLTRINKTGGRTNGKVTAGRKSGGHKRNMRTIDFKRNKIGISALVVSVEYDPNRTSNIALLNYKDGEKRYILAPNGLKVGDTLISGDTAEVRAGNAMPLARIPIGTVVHNIEL